MRFWDSSAIVPLIADEAATDAVTALLLADAAMIVSFITPIEIDSAVWRKALVTRDADARLRSQRRLAELRGAWMVLRDHEAVLETAATMVARHGLRAADAIQLASGLHARGNGRMAFVTRDDDLAAAARAEGFPVLP